MNGSGSKQTLIYSFVAKGSVVLAEHTAFSGNFSTIAVQCLQKLPPNSTRSTYSCDGHTFNFLVDRGFGMFHASFFCSLRLQGLS
jgi:vesicle-associated membrane protein 72